MQPRPSTRVVLSITFAALASIAAPIDEGTDGAPKPWGPIQILGRSTAPGDKSRFAYSQTGSFESAFLNTVVFVARGTRAGPNLCLSALVHGDERNGFEVARQTFEEIDPKQLAGTLIALPAVNAHGFRTGSRYMPDRRDLNRAFPGSDGSSNTAVIAAILFQTATRVCDRLIDLHTGSLDRANLPQIRVDLGNPAALEMAKHFGAPVVLGGAGPRGSLRREMTDAGVPTIIYEAGLPLRFEPPEIERGVKGVRNVMIALGMRSGRKGPPTPPRRIFARSRWQRVPLGQGGVFYPTKALGDRITAGELVARIDDPFTDARYEITAEASGTIVGMAAPQIVFSGYALIHVAGP
ncbi:MAG: succinylglutamate desuccinylase/aspartoacylase family protein [Myxococcota bacterium]